MSSIENAKKIKEIFGCTIPTSFSMGHGIFELTLSKSRLSYVSVIPVDFNISYIDDRIVQSTSILSPKVISLIDYQTLNMFDGSDEEFEAFMLWKINILDKITSDIDYFIDRTGSRMTINYIRNI